MRLLRPRSLLVRIMVAEVAAIGVVALLLPWLMVSVLRGATHGVQRDVLIEQARAIAGAVDRDGAGRWHVLLPPATRGMYANRYDGRSYVIVRGGGLTLAASPYAGLAPWRAALREAEPTDFKSGPFVGVSLPARVQDIPIWVLVAQDENGPGAIVDDVVDTFLPRYSAMLLAVLLMLPFFNGLLIRRLVVSVRQASDSAAEIGAVTLDRRLAADQVPSEVAPLVRALNALLDRLHQSFRQQSEFVGNVAHELRTPLATLRLRLETVADPELRRALERQCGRLEHVVSQLHDLASLELLAQETMTAFDPATLAREIVHSRAEAIRRGGRTLDFAVADRVAVVRANRFLVGVALANLIDNVGRHTPAGSHAVVTVAAAGTITVEDDGPGFASPMAEAPRRFWRAGHLRSDSAGLGLSIVRRVMEVHGGTLRIEACVPHGARITLALPPTEAVAIAQASARRAGTIERRLR